MIIRDATLRELPTLAMIAESGFPPDDCPTVDTLQGWVTEYSISVKVCRDHGNTVGFIVVQREDGVSLVRMIAVCSMQRRKGYATKMLQQVEGPAVAWIKEDNHASRALFASCGFDEHPLENADGWCCYRLDAPQIAGVGADAPTTVNAAGGKQSASPYRCDLLPPQATFRVAAVLKHGADKYGTNNWHAIPVEDHINHALVHLLAFLAGDRQDDHLGHAACRAMFALDQHLSGRGTDAAA